MTRILLAEDEERISNFVQRGLRSAGYLCSVVRDGPDALHQALSGEFDLVLLDVGLPVLDGLRVLRDLRRSDRTLPVIMLTARSAAADVVSGLDAGANDYLTKPFKFDELLARVRLRLRERPVPAEAGLQRGSLRVDTRSRRAFVREIEIHLSVREFALVIEFLRHPDQVLSHDQLLGRVWGADFELASNAVGTMVGSLRSKIGADAIETIRGVGYRLK